MKENGDNVSLHVHSVLGTVHALQKILQKKTFVTAFLMVISV